MEIHDGLQEIERGGACRGVFEGAGALHQALDAPGVRLEFGVAEGAHLPPAKPNMGECRVSSTLPSPRNM